MQKYFVCLFDCGFIPRCALENEDSGEVRIEKIFKIISQCKFGIHDISRTGLCEKTKLPRFNMPLELGIFLGAKKYGKERKNCLITDSEKYRYQSFISDLAGNDIKAHNNKPENLIILISTWLRNATKGRLISGGAEVNRRYKNFSKTLPSLCEEQKITIKEMSFNGYAQLVCAWLDSDRKKSAH